MSNVVNQYELLIDVVVGPKRNYLDSYHSVRPVGLCLEFVLRKLYHASREGVGNCSKLSIV